jgi:hypothetical protein
VRTGLTRRQTGPSRTEATGTQIHITTYSTPGTGLSRPNGGPTSSSRTTQPAVSTPAARSARRVAGVSRKRASGAGSGRPDSSPRNRDRRHARASTSTVATKRDHRTGQRVLEWHGQSPADRRCRAREPGPSSHQKLSEHPTTLVGLTPNNPL